MLGINSVIIAFRFYGMVQVNPTVYKPDVLPTRRDSDSPTGLSQPDGLFLIMEYNTFYWILYNKFEYVTGLRNILSIRYERSPIIGIFIH